MINRTLAKLALLALSASPVFAQAPPPAQPIADKPASAATAVPTQFEAADVHFTPPYRVPFYSGAFLSGDRYIIHQATMVHLVATAYNFKEPAYVGGGPTWLAWDRYDLMAKVPPGTTLETARVMLQNMLAERFKLVVHPGDVPIPAYVLTVTHGKPNLKPSTATEEGSCKFQPTFPSGPGSTASFALDCHAVSMESLAKSLDESEGRDYVPYNTPVVDTTGVKGLYDLDLKWTPKWFLTQAGSAGVTIFQALGQYGLNLDYKTVPRPGLIVDSVNREPTPNAPDLARIMPPLPPPQFEVATIRPAQPADQGLFMARGDELNIKGVPLKMIIKMAWDLDWLNDDMLAAPKWIETDKIDIHAKVAASDLGNNTMGRSNSMNFDDFRPMLRALLIDRFEIKYHTEDRPIDAYTLEVADPKLASLKLTKADPSERITCGGVLPSGDKNPQPPNPMLDSSQSCWNMTMDRFAGQLHRIAPDYFFFPVKDETGLTGAYDFTMFWSSARLVQGSTGPRMGPPPPPSADGAPAASDPNGAISFSDAIKKQLGLKIVKEKRPEPVLVIDAIDQEPTAN